MGTPVAWNRYAWRDGGRFEERRSRRVRVRAHPGPRDRTVAMVTPTIRAHRAKASGSLSDRVNKTSIYRTFFMLGLFPAAQP